MFVAVLGLVSELFVAAYSVTDEGLGMLTALQQLRSLELCGGRVTNNGLPHIGSLSNLSYLNVSQNAGITCAGIRHLLPLRHLMELNLSYTGVRSAGALQLTALRRLHSLTAYECGVSDWSCLGCGRRCAIR
jgi:hypothetical protein